MVDSSRNKTYFASDFHLGVDAITSSKERELIICSWLESIQDQAKCIYLLGDIFDYWYEYKNSIPSGFSHFLSAIRQLRNKGVEIHFFTGNHDMWMFNYFTKEYDIQVHTEPITMVLDNKRFYIGHGDGIGPGDYGYKLIKALFSNRFCQWLFSLVHPTIALQLMKKISQRDSKKYTKPPKFELENEWLIQFALKRKYEYDYFIFGHRHLLYDYPLSEKSRILNLGDWISYNSYAVWDGKNLKIEQYGDYLLGESVL